MEKVIPFKILFLGNPSTSKTSFLKRYLYDDFNNTENSTIGFDVFNKQISVHPKSEIVLNIWDIGGSISFQRFRNFHLFERTSAVVLNIDLTNRKTFEDLKTWLKLVNKNIRKRIPVLLFSQKLDLEPVRKVLKIELEIFCENHNLTYFEVSAKYNINVKESMNFLINLLLSSEDEELDVDDFFFQNKLFSQNSSEFFQNKDKLDVILDNLKQKENVVEIYFKNVVFKIPVFLLWGKKVKKFLRTNKNQIFKRTIDMSISIERIYKSLLGMDVVFDCWNDYIDFFMFFKILNMKKHMYVVCKQIYNNLKDLDELIEFFKKIYTKFEVFTKLNLNLKKKVNFKSVLTLTVFNILRTKYFDILKNKKYVLFFKENNLFEQLKPENIFPIGYHEDLGKKIHFKKLLNFQNIYNQNIFKLYKKEAFCNCQLKSSIVDSKRIKHYQIFGVHKEILIEKSNFFLLMFRFNGSECQKKLIEIKDLNGNELDALIQFIYLNKINSNHFQTLIKLMVHAHKYFENNLMNYLVKKSVFIVENLLNFDIFEIELMRYKKIFENVPEEFMMSLFKFWEKKFRDVKIENLIKIVNS